MPKRKVEEEVLFERIAEVFRRYGYEGASLSLLSEATGLERASLYHRFPRGKEEMASAVVARTCEWFGEHVFDPLQESGSLDARLRRVAANLRGFYRRGTLWCVLDTMTLGHGTDSIRAQIRDAYVKWREAFEKVAREAGMTPARARARAEKAIVEIEGSLVLARVTGDSQHFLRLLRRLPEVLAPSE